MKIPDSLFFIVNAVMRALLRSPLHGLMSDSILVLTFKGRKSGREFSTPLRYLRIGNRIRCNTSEDTQWWRNMAGNPEVTLLVAGQRGRYRAHLHDRDPEKMQQMLEEILAVYPQDAAYMEVRLDRDKRPDPLDLERSARRALVVDFEEI